MSDLSDEEEIGFLTAILDYLLAQDIHSRDPQLTDEIDRIREEIARIRERQSQTTKK